MSGALQPLRPMVFTFVLLGLLWWGFDAFLTHRAHPNRGIETGAGAAERLVLDAGPGGHYMVPGEINGERVSFLIDTGASHVAVPAHLAGRLGLARGRPIGVNTAAGRAMAYDTTIDEIAIGGLRARRVRGSINPAMSGDFVLLGMTFLRQVDLSQRGGRLIIEAAGERR
jgi:aspartyl protease family protein